MIRKFYILLLSICILFYPIFHFVYAAGGKAPAAPTGLSSFTITPTSVYFKWTNDITVTTYNVYRDGILISCDTTNGKNTCLDNSVSGVHTYSYTVSATNANGTSALSSPLSVNVPLGTPANIKIMELTSSKIRLVWDNVSFATSYEVRRNGVLLNSVSTATYTDSTLTSNTSYTYTIRAANSTGTSSDATINITSPDSSVPVPSNFRVNKTTNISAHLLWDSNPSLVRYELKRNGDIIYSGTDNYYIDSSLHSNSSYFYTLAGYDSNGKISGTSPLNISTTNSLLTGNGTSATPYIIDDIYKLQQMREFTSGTYFSISNDINAYETKNWNGGQGFIPIGTSASPLSFTIEGNNHVISGLSINLPNGSNVGLLGYMNGGTYSRIHIQDGNILGKDTVGGFAGYVKNATVQYSSFEGNASGRTLVGGLIGSGTSSSILYSYTKGTVSETDNANTTGFAGLVANSGTSLTVTYCFSESDVYAPNKEDVAGLVAFQKLNDNYSNSYSRGDVTGFNFTSGFASNSSSQTISNSYSTGKVINTVTTSVNGIYYNGFAPAGTVTNSFWDINTSGQSTSDSGTGKTSSELKTQSTFTGWDFTNVWGLNPSINDGYPYLKMVNVIPSGPSIPTTPSNFKTVTVASSSISLSWDAVSGATSYELSRNGSVIYTGSNINFTDIGLSPNQSYSYSIKAVNSAGSSSPGNLNTKTLVGSLGLIIPTIDNFPNAVLNASSIHTSFSSFLIVNDSTGLNEGWSLSVQATPFQEIGGLGYQLPKLSLKLFTPNINAESGNSSTLPKTTNADGWYIDADTPVNILHADAGEGNGKFYAVFPFQALSLTLNPHTFHLDSANYPNIPTPFQSTLTWKISTGP